MAHFWNLLCPGRGLHPQFRSDQGIDRHRNTSGFLNARVLTELNPTGLPPIRDRVARKSNCKTERPRNMLGLGALILPVPKDANYNDNVE